MSTRIGALFSAVFCGILLIGSTSLFGQISVTTDTRTVLIQGPLADMNQMATATPLTPMNVSFNQSSEPYTNQTGGTFSLSVAASQNSTVDLTGQTLHVSDSGQASFDVTQTGGPAQNEGIILGGATSYSVTFQLASPAAYTVVEQTAFTDREGVSGGAALYPVNSTTSLIPSPIEPSPSPVTFTGTLAPGSYTFLGNANAGDENFSGSASFSADLLVQATPEPTGLLPVAIGMIALLRRRV